MCTIQSISEVLQTKPLILADQTQLISELAYDSRKINHPDHSLFLRSRPLVTATILFLMPINEESETSLLLILPIFYRIVEM